MSLSEILLGLAEVVVYALSPLPWSAACPSCGGSLEWVTFFGKEKRIRCLECKREWVKGRRGRWEVDYPHNPT